ncbi:hypothetical protein [Microcoleus sp. OTE_8_concoct_300]|uniref:hypothetical protein n=1 Tax=Microcoleus sp. OTE_8_concoct_300 TaxID=2964710 RepID=UPI00403F8580
MESRAAISIAEIKSKYGIKQSAAYKWRTALRNLGVEESWANYDRIKSRELNLSEALKISTQAERVKPAKPAGKPIAAIAIMEPHVEINQINQIDQHEKAAPPIFGISPQRLAEINATVELEVMVEDALYEHHRQKRRGERAAKAAQTVKEVQALDPKLIVEMAMRQIAKVQEIA